MLLARSVGLARFAVDFDRKPPFGRRSGKRGDKKFGHTTDQVVKEWDVAAHVAVRCLSWRFHSVKIHNAK